MGTTLLGAVCNIILDPIFIFSMNLGVVGASIATILSQFISFIWLFIFFVQKKSVFHFQIKEMKPKLKIITGILALGLSPFIMVVTESFIQIVFNDCLKIATGGESSEYTAALTIMLSALQLISLPLNGLGYGIAPFVSYNYGKGDAYRLKKGIQYTFMIGFVFDVIIYTISMACPQIYAYVFNAEGEVLTLIKQYTPLFLMGTIMFCVQATLQYVNVALGRGKTATILAFLRKVVILIPLYFILTYTLGYQGVYMAEGIADLIAGTITSIVIFTTFPRVIRKRAAEVAHSNSLNNKEL